MWKVYLFLVSAEVPWMGHFSEKRAYCRSCQVPGELNLPLGQVQEQLGFGRRRHVLRQLYQALWKYETTATSAEGIKLARNEGLLPLAVHDFDHYAAAYIAEGPMAFHKSKVRSHPFRVPHLLRAAQ